MSAPRPQPEPGPLILLLKSGALFYGAHWLEHHIVEEPLIILFAAILRIAALLIALKASGAVLRLLFDIFKTLRSWRRSTLKGSSELLTEREARKAGLHRKGRHGRFLGVLRRTAIWAASETHQLIVGPAGTQKSTAGFFPALCSLWHSALVNDTKKELYHVTAAFRRRFFGHEIAVLDPDDPDTACVNPLDVLAGLISADSGKAITFARAMAKQLKPDPPKPDQNAYFTGGARTLITNLSCVIATVCTPAHRTLATLYQALNDPDFLHQLLDQGMASDALNGAVSEMAGSLHAIAFADDDRTYQQFRTGAEQAVEIFARGGPLEHITSKTTFDFSDLKRKKMTVYLVVDYASKEAAGQWAGLMQWMATRQLVEVRNNKPVYLLLDEFCNAPVHSLPTDLTLLRQYGVRCIMATQDLDDITRVYGKHALETVLSEADIKQFLGGIRSQTTLDYISKYMGNSTERASNFSYGRDGLQESVSRTAKPILTPDEIRRLDKRSQIVFIGNLKPAIMHKVQVFSIAPWRRKIGINTMYSKRRYLLPVEVRLRWWGTEVTRRGVQPAPRRPSNWPRWIPLIGKLMPGAWVFVVLAAIYTLSEEGSPHLRASDSYIGPYYARVFTECHYVGVTRFTTYGPNCPVIVFEKPQRR